MRKISFVIPCYNSEKTILGVINEIESTVKDDYEIVLVNDYSKDNVWKVICDLCKKNKKVKAINFSQNFGQHSALMAGYRYVTGDLVVSLDDDGQIPVDEVYSLIDKLDEGYDVVLAKYESKKHNIFRNIGTLLNNLMARVLIDKPKGLSITSFSVAKRYIIEEIVKYNNPYPYVAGLLFRCTKNVASVPVKHRKRTIGKSGYTFSKLLKLWLNGFTAFSVKPLRLATLLGLLSSIIGFIFIIIIVVNKIFGNYVVLGWSSLISVILLLGGLILITLGLIGEYIGRIYICINNSPQYVIKEKINIDDK